MNKKLFSISVFILLLVMANSLFAQTTDNKQKANPDSTQTKTSFYEKLLKHSENKAQGFIDIYYYQDKLYFEVPFSLMGKDMLLASTISKTSDNRFGTVGARHKPLHVEFTKVDSTLLLHRVENGAVVTDGNRKLLSALAKNNLGAIIKLFKIKAFNKDTTAAVINVTHLFLSGNSKLSPFGTVSFHISKANFNTSFQRGRSFITGFKSFKKNLTVSSSLSFDYTLKKDEHVIAKNAPFTAVMMRTLMLLPEHLMQPRMADYRIGIFTTNKYRFAETAEKSKQLHFADRWQLIPSNKKAYLSGKLVKPVEPIVFYIDKDFPKSWKEPIRKGILDWNKAFRKIGFKNAIVVKDYPENNPEFDPDNLMYNVVRYAPLPVGNAMGPHWVDPRTGQILNASVYLYHGIIKLLTDWMFIQISPADKALRSAKIPEKYMKQAIRYVVRHEIGHTLGFKHNMAASSSIPVDSLRSPTFTQKYSDTYSVMDYARYNYVAQPGDKQRGVKLTPPILGPYDYFLVKWNYMWFPHSMSRREVHKKLTQMIDEKVGDPRYHYGQQGDRIDPRSQAEDLGRNHVKASTYGIKNLKFIMTHLNDWVADADKNYKFRERIWNGIFAQYVRYINHVFRVVGGIYTNKIKEGDPLPHYKSVSRRRQKTAFHFILKQITNLDWLKRKKVIQSLPLMGTPVKTLRKSLIKAVLKSPAKVALSAQKSDQKNPYTPADVMSDIYHSFWSSTMKNQPLTHIEKQLQMAFVNWSISKSGLEPAGGDTNSFAFQADLTVGIELPSKVKENLIKSYGQNLFRKYIATGKHWNNASQMGLFGLTVFQFPSRPDLHSLYYSYLLKVKDLVENSLKHTTDVGTKLHYKLILKKLDVIL